MSPVALKPREEEGYLRLPRRWSLAMLVGALGYGVVMVWQVALVYADVGQLKTATSKHEARIDEVQRLGERIARLEAQAGLQLDILRRMETKVGR